MNKSSYFCYDSIKRMPIFNIDQSIELYNRAIQLSPFDALYYHNLSWLYFLKNDISLAFDYINSSIALAYNNPLYHISKGMMLETINASEAYHEYQIAITISPDICDSDFYNDLKSRNQDNATKIISNISNLYSNKQKQRYSVITEAKQAKLLLEQKNIPEAYKLLINVTNKYPGLSRPWFYLGIIEQQKSNYKSMLNYYRKALFIHPNDYLSLNGMMNYYQMEGDYINAEKYLKLIMKLNNSIKSIHSSRSLRIYNLKTFEDDIIPKNLLKYISPNFNYNVDNPEHMHPVQKEKESQIGSKRFDLNSHSGRYAPIFREK